MHACIHTYTHTVESDIEKAIEEFHEVLMVACNESFRTKRVSKRMTLNRTMPWLTEELTIMRKRLNELRRRYKRTRNNEELRHQREAQYLEGKGRYTSTIKKEKLSSWIAYCNLTPATNPWNEVYKLAAGKKKNNTQLTTLRKPDGTLTKDTRDTLQHIHMYIQYSLLNLTFMRRTKTVAFADDLLLITRGKTVSEAESFLNLEMSKITAWSKRIKVGFNEEKSKTMLISWRKRKEVKDIKIDLNNKPLEQVTTMKYLGIIIDDKFKFSQHISYAADKCAKLIFSLSKSAKISWGLKHEVPKTIYKGAILPLLLYGAPVWIEATKYGYNRRKYIRVQRLMNIRIAKAYHTTSSEALCIVTGTTPIIIKFEEAAKHYNVWKGNRGHTQKIDLDVELNHWPHPADLVNITEDNGYNKQTIQVYTDGSKSERGVGSGVAIFISKELKSGHKYKLNYRCSNNQVEQLAIAKALELIHDIDITENTPP